jgi:hypothetical protein
VPEPDKVHLNIGGKLHTWTEGKVRSVVLKRKDDCRLKDVWRILTANCIIIDHFSAFEPGLVDLFLTLPLKNGWQWVKTA